MYCVVLYVLYIFLWLLNCTRYVTTMLCCVYYYYTVKDLERGCTQISVYIVFLCSMLHDAPNCSVFSCKSCKQFYLSCVYLIALDRHTANGNLNNSIRIDRNSPDWQYHFFVLMHVLYSSVYYWISFIYEPDSVAFCNECSLMY